MTFSMWSFGHYLFLISPFITLLILYLFTHKKTLSENRKIGIILSLIAIGLLILRNIEIWVVSGYQFDIELLPLQVCHFANFVLLIAFISNKQIWFNFALILNLPAAFVSILFANGLENYANILTLRGIAYIIGHMLLVSIPLWTYLVGFTKLNFRTFFKTVKLVAILYFISFFINNLMFVLFNQYSNYFYSLKPELGTPLESFYNMGETIYIFNIFKFNPIYLLLTALFAGVIMFTLYIGFYLHQIKWFNQLFKKDSNITQERIVITESE
ncbi:TMEM164 family acyltransferase [Liberiplasma polymorphum]|uniref:TMEM164 family acyltransferase n=1 Tax=Liberiplasma polymorphum TaxID=3374570 RepID=UPI0037726E8A